MASDLLEVIIKAIDQASGPAKSVDDAFDKLGNTATNSNQKMGQASQMTEQKMQQLKTSISDVSSFTASATSKGASQFKRYNSSVQDSIIKFNTLDDETQEWLNRLNNAHNPQVFYELNSKCQEAVSKFQQLDSLTDTWSGSLDYARSKMELMGNSTETLKGKAQTVGTAIQTYVGNKWDTIKGKVSSFASFLSTKLTSALSKVRAGLDTLGSAFSGLGGIISSAIGAIGMNSIKDMTVGLAMNRERMTALTSATMGGAEAGQHFVGVMDNLTNSSLVSLDDLGQAMSTIKMSTGMSNAELEKFTTTVNDVGQRAILMGKSGDEAMSLMQAAGRGLNGEFDMLKTNFGITKEQLQDLGWSGAADDVEGYQAALDKALEKGGSMNGMMDTSVGHLETLKKNFRVAGRHVGEMFTPYIDQAVQYLNGLNDTCPGLFENLVMVAGAVSGFATIAPTLSPMLSAFDSISGAGKSMFGILKTGVGTVRAFHTALAAGEGIQAAVTAGFTAMGASELLVLWPLALIVAAIIAIGVAVYEIGKAVGWWSDFGTMLEAVQAGVMRLWEAFINHPDVQATIAAVSSALGTLWSWIQQAGAAIAEFFGISTGGDWDIVSQIIQVVGAAWQVLTGHIRLAIQIIQMVIGAFQSAYESIVSFGSYIMDILSPAFTLLGELWNGLMAAIQPIIAVFQQFMTGQTDLLTVITTVATTMWNLWITLTSNLGNLILTLVGNLLTWAIQAGLNFLTGISLYLSQVAGRVRAYLMNTLTNIISVATRWVNTGRQKASQFLNGVISFFRQLPGRALSILLSVVSSIISAGSQWVSNAKNKASSVVTGVVGIIQGLPGKISSALSGVVSAITSPFSTAYSKVCGIVDNIKSKVNDAMNYIGGLGGAAGGDLAAGGDSPSVSDFNIFTGEYNTANSGTEKIEVEETLTIILDFINVPSDIDTDLLIRSLTDPKVLSALVSNPKFQDLDAKIKAKIDGKYRRSVGG